MDVYGSKGGDNLKKKSTCLFETDLKVFRSDKASGLIGSHQRDTYMEI